MQVSSSTAAAQAQQASNVQSKAASKTASAGKVQSDGYDKVDISDAAKAMMAAKSEKASA